MNHKELIKKFARMFIPNLGTVVIVIALLWAQQTGAMSLLSSDASSTTTISYQGRLADSGGNPITDTPGMTFRIYNAATGGSALWTETYPAVQVSDGLFHVLLGSTTPLPNNLFSDNATLYLGITVGADSEMIPREQLASAPWAMTVPDGAIGTEKIAEGAVHSRHALLSSGRVSSSDTLSLTNSYQDVPGTTFTVSPETAQRYLVYVIADLYTKNAVAVATLIVDGGSQGAQAIFQDSNGASRGTVTQTYLIDFEPGIHTINLKAKLVAGESGTIYGGHTTITYFAISQ